MSVLLFISLFYVILNGHFIAMDNGLKEPICTSRFDYEHKMLHQMVLQEIEQKKMKESINDLNTLINTLKDENAEYRKAVKAVEDNLNKIEAKCLRGSSESSYVRWGRTKCPANGTELVYKGFAGGARYDKAGASNYLCLPDEPIWGAYEDAEQSSGTVWGVEYELHQRNMNNFFGKALHNHDVPCCVCATKRSNMLMLPGRNVCYDGWTLEYSGYLVSDHETHHASEFLCLDSGPEFLPNGSSDKNGRLLYFVEARCGSLPCPPYVNGRELTCAVCSK
ncbi:uncharacterized protein LOC132731104 [Ruditapes philippinarum]|uniref:uncharacterized protein LOC132731104 n=1 Tax=Ruditapes philippinarum TaxID=129788 RepID=UPI00295AACB9|nr:uncharacterized protein LOC132731104 [Ruditapes philippinarum]